MKKHHPVKSLVAYVGFLDGRPHIQREDGSGGPLVLACYTSRRAASRAYADVRTARIVFDADWRGGPR